VVFVEAIMGERSYDAASSGRTAPFSIRQQESSESKSAETTKRKTSTSTDIIRSMGRRISQAADYLSSTKKVKDAVGEMKLDESTKPKEESLTTQQKQKLTKTEKKSKENAANKTSEKSTTSNDAETKPITKEHLNSMASSLPDLPSLPKDQTAKSNENLETPEKKSESTTSKDSETKPITEEHLTSMASSLPDLPSLPQDQTAKPMTKMERLVQKHFPNMKSPLPDLPPLPAVPTQTSSSATPASKLTPQPAVPPSADKSASEEEQVSRSEHSPSQASSSSIPTPKSTQHLSASSKHTRLYEAALQNPEKIISGTEDKLLQNQTKEAIQTENTAKLGYAQLGTDLGKITDFNETSRKMTDSNKAALEPFRETYESLNALMTDSDKAVLKQFQATYESLAKVSQRIENKLQSAFQNDSLGEFLNVFTDSEDFNEYARLVSEVALQYTEATAAISIATANIKAQIDKSQNEKEKKELQDLKMSLEKYPITGIQRIPRFVLLVAEFSKKIPEKNESMTEFHTNVLDFVKEKASSVNEITRQGEITKKFENDSERLRALISDINNKKTLKDKEGDKLKGAQNAMEDLFFLYKNSNHPRAKEILKGQSIEELLSKLIKNSSIKFFDKTTGEIQNLSYPIKSDKDNQGFLNLLKWINVK